VLLTHNVVNPIQKVILNGTHSEVKFIDFCRVITLHVHIVQYFDIFVSSAIYH
jgi:hypothetical protein